MNNIFSNLNIFAHYLVAQVLQSGGTAVDATAGNGWDTLFLAQKVTSSGQVFSFDIQEQALEKTNDLLRSHQEHQQVRLILTGHENLAQIIKVKVQTIMFNLGYLPGGDHSLITLPKTTIAGIRQGLDLLDLGGIMTITVYSGHQGATEEKEMVEKFLKGLNSQKWDVLKWNYLNKSELAPFVLAIYRRGE